MNTSEEFCVLMTAFQQFFDTLQDLTGEPLLELVLTAKQQHIIKSITPYSFDKTNEAGSTTVLGVPVTVKQNTEAKPKQFTLVPELGVIIWNNTEPVYGTRRRKLAIPCPSKINTDFTSEPAFFDELVQYKEYIFDAVDFYGKLVWMTPYLPEDETLCSLLK